MQCTVCLFMAEPLVLDFFLTLFDGDLNVARYMITCVLLWMFILSDFKVTAMSER